MPCVARGDVGSAGPRKSGCAFAPRFDRTGSASLVPYRGARQGARTRIQREYAYASGACKRGRIHRKFWAVPMLNLRPRRWYAGDVSGDDGTRMLRASSVQRWAKRMMRCATGKRKNRLAPSAVPGRSALPAERELARDHSPHHAPAPLRRRLAGSCHFPSTMRVARSRSLSRSSQISGPHWSAGISPIAPSRYWLCSSQECVPVPAG